MKTVRTADERSYRNLDTERLRQSFIIENLFKQGQAEFVLTDLDRAIAGGIIPVDAPLALNAGFCERREAGVLNLGAAGAIVIDGVRFRLAPLDCLYIGRGSSEVTFASDSPRTPACYYLVSYPAHAQFPTAHAGADQATCVEAGSPKDANRRTIRQYIHPKGIRSCQLVMGFTELHEGSVWNTFPPHTHARRSEIYCYFDMPPGGCALHLLGTPGETRHVIVRERQVVLSPEWSIHSGIGTGGYRFVWAMGGENQVFEDMDAVDVAKLH